MYESLKDRLFRYKEVIENSATAEKGTYIKMPIMSIIFGPFSVLADKFMPLLMALVPYAIVLTLISFAFGFSYMCLMNVDMVAYCSKSEWAYALYSIIRIPVITMFVVRFYSLAYDKENFSKKDFFKFGKKDLKLLLVFSVILLTCVFPVLSYYVLYIRVPSPDWVLEVIFFGFVSIGFLIPFFTIRFYSIIGFVLDDEPIPSLATIWLRGRRNGLRIIFGLFLILVFAILLITNYFVNFKSVEPPVSLYVSVVAEFLYNVIAMILVVLLTNHGLIQKALLFNKGEEQNG